MRFNLDFEGKGSIRQFESLPKHVQKVIFRALDKKLLNDPYHYGIPLKGPFLGYYKFRVGDYRVVFRIEKEKIVLVIFAIGNRKNVYEHLLRTLK